MNNSEVEWKVIKRALIPRIPQHKTLSLSPMEQKLLLRKYKVHLIRWISDWDMQVKTNYWYVIKDSFEDISTLKKKHRYQINKGLNNCDVKLIEPLFLFEHGYPIYSKAYQSYKKKDSSVVSVPTMEEFLQTYKEASKVSQFWGVFEKRTNKFIGFAENVIRGNTVIYGSMKFDPNYLKLYSSYALIYKMNQYYLQKMKFDYVSDGPRSFIHETNIQDLLVTKFNFRKAYCKLNVAYSPLLKVAVFLLYPLRGVLNKIDQRYFRQLSMILKMHEICIHDRH